MRIQDVGTVLPAPRQRAGDVAVELQELVASLRGMSDLYCHCHGVNRMPPLPGDSDAIPFWDCYGLMVIGQT